MGHFLGLFAQIRPNPRPSWAKLLAGYPSIRQAFNLPTVLDRHPPLLPVAYRGRRYTKSLGKFIAPASDARSGLIKGVKEC